MGIFRRIFRIFKKEPVDTSGIVPAHFVNLKETEKFLYESTDMTRTMVIDTLEEQWKKIENKPWYKNSETIAFFSLITFAIAFVIILIFLFDGMNDMLSKLSVFSEVAANFKEAAIAAKSSCLSGGIPSGGQYLPPG